MLGWLSTRSLPVHQVLGVLSAVMAAACCVIGWILIPTVDVESVVITGPVLFVLGFGLMVTIWIGGARWTALVAAGHMCVCVLFFTLVNVLRWSPDDAHTPFMIMGGVYTLLIVPATVAACMHWPRVRQPWECQKCGYPLVNLDTEPCPECGQPFEPVVVRDAMVQSGVSLRD